MRSAPRFDKSGNMRITYLMALVICFYCMLDVYNTWLLLRLGGIEVNPLMRWLLQVTGTVYSLVVIKALFLFALLILLMIRRRQCDE
jgi:uncharacterized membrane protein